MRRAFASSESRGRKLRRMKTAPSLFLFLVFLYVTISAFETKVTECDRLMA